MEDQAFKLQITSEPGDDANRLVYADWLDEHNRPIQAEFIRTACALQGATTKVRQELKKKLKKLFSYHHISLIIGQNQPGLFGSGLKFTHFRRGMLEHVRWTLQKWIKWGPKIVREFPITSLNIYAKIPRSRDIWTGLCQRVGPYPHSSEWLNDKGGKTNSWLCFGWTCDQQNPLINSKVPEFIWKHLSNWDLKRNKFKAYTTAEKAKKALNEASLEWALSEADIKRD